MDLEIASLETTSFLQTFVSFLSNTSLRCKQLATTNIYVMSCCLLEGVVVVMAADVTGADVMVVTFVGVT